ncbi:MAG: hypothetical protein HOQ05_04365 [Corynebacteriales bacterium]|nr:hypothetical protein [Mycobacteriales bacterium]
MDEPKADHQAAAAGSHSPTPAPEASAVQPGPQVPPYGAATPPAWGAPATGQRAPWNLRKTLGAVVVVVVLAIAGGALFMAAADNDSDSGPGGRAGGPGQMGQLDGQNNQGFSGGFPGAGGVGLAGALHGEFVTSENGEYVTRQLHTGTVTKIAADSITVKSSDDYSQSYAISDSTTVGNNGSISDIAEGDTVTLIASEDKNAISISSQQEMQGNGAPGQGG